MVNAIVGLAHNFGMDVVAEGVETAEQLACVRRLGCNFAQGFYFSKAIEAAAVEPLIAAQPWRALATRVGTDAGPVLSDVVN
jgi:EAL domain-containing protein (putative c-di-GMP-specific phosphodiesterase class I)